GRGDGILRGEVDAAGAERGDAGHGGPSPRVWRPGIRAGMLVASGTIRPPPTPGTRVNSPSPRAHRTSPVTAGDQAVPGGAAGPAAGAAPPAAAGPPAAPGGGAAPAGPRRPPGRPGPRPARP